MHVHRPRVRTCTCTRLRRILAIRMVFFTCGACGASLKKNQVEKHYQTECRRCEVLSCMDCGRDFYGDEYAKHTKCITEAEKYQGATLSESAKGPGKGERKQQEWLELVQRAVLGSEVSTRVAGLLERIADYPNIPRKRPKFENFIRNSFNVHDARTLGELWSVFDEVIKSKSSLEQPQQTLASSDSSTSTSRPPAATCSAVQNASPEQSERETKSLIEKKKQRKKKSTVENGAEASPEQSELETTSSPSLKKKHKKKKCRQSEVLASREEMDGEAVVVNGAGLSDTEQSSRGGKEERRQRKRTRKMAAGAEESEEKELPESAEVEPPIDDDKVQSDGAKTKRKKRKSRQESVDDGEALANCAGADSSGVGCTTSSCESRVKEDVDSGSLQSTKRHHKRGSVIVGGGASLKGGAGTTDAVLQETDGCEPPPAKHKKKTKC